MVRSAGRRLSSFYAGQVPMDRELGRIGFMSTQRREIRWQRTSCTEHTGAPTVSGSESSSPVRVSRGQKDPASAMQFACARAIGGTAPPEAAFGLPSSNAGPLQERKARLATNSLHPDYRLEQFVRQDNRCGSPPLGAGSRAVAAKLDTRRSSHSRLPIPPGFASFHPTLPQAPVGTRRRAERYDGKRDLHLQHAA